jgi:hypothetical protein
MLFRRRRGGIARWPENLGGEGLRPGRREPAQPRLNRPFRVTAPPEYLEYMPLAGGMPAVGWPAAEGKGGGGGGGERGARDARSRD